ncbi:DUF7860 family protein [Halorhabdus amylolytica]|uniref:DUF7860 family protein n=1 Tax=Halorhabdus amylolytica TaxID=2559573 RepID=UPI0010A9B41E|nr:hypothetical protein [Halorhabdus amylolytica]
MSGYRDMDYVKLARWGFVLGAAMFLIGGVGQAVVPGLPGWEKGLLLDLEVGGIFVGLLAPLTFGIVLPLTE